MSVVGATPIVDYFRRGDVPRDVRLLAAEGVLAPGPLDQLLLLAWLTADADPEVAATAERTLTAIPTETIAGFLARQDVPADLRRFCTGRGIEPAAVPLQDPEQPLVNVEGAADTETPEGDKLPLSMLPIKDKVKLAMRGSREQRAQLVRDPNKLVSVAVLSSPKLTESEVEAFARMGNVSEEVLRTIGSNRTWVRNYGVMSGLARNPKTPLTVSLHLIPHLNVRDIKLMSTDRNLPEQVRLGARKIMSKYRQG
jgi:hypothetical protein